MLNPSPLNSPADIYCRRVLPLVAVTLSPFVIAELITRLVELVADPGVSKFKQVVIDWRRLLSVAPVLSSALTWFATSAVVVEPPKERHAPGFDPVSTPSAQLFLI
jgi:hypothetical protein